MPFPNIDPVALSLGPFELRWYGLAYFVGILVGIWYAERLIRKFAEFELEPGAFDNFVVWAVAGILLGGRLGIILLYNTDYYLAHPIKIFALNEGGMSFHGGFLGVVVSSYLYCRRNRLSFLAFGDVMACVSGVGIFLVRIANFINGELWGRPTDAPWAVVFPNPAGGGLPRHPSQLYEAALEGLALFIIINLLARRRGIRARHGLLASVFMIGYAIVRILVEFTREPDAPLFGALTRGQAYSLPMLISALAIVALVARRNRDSHRTAPG